MRRNQHRIATSAIATTSQNTICTGTLSVKPLIRLSKKDGAAKSGMFDLPMMRRLMLHRMVIIRMPASSVLILKRRWMKAVAQPDRNAGR